MNTLSAILTALRAGQELSNAAVWKNRQILTSVVAALIGAVLILLRLAGVEIALGADDIATLAGAIALVAGLLNGTATAATSRKVGLPPRSDRNDGPGSPPPATQSAPDPAWQPDDSWRTDPLGNDQYTGA